MLRRRPLKQWLFFLWIFTDGANDARDYMEVIVCLIKLLTNVHSSLDIADAKVIIVHVPRSLKKALHQKQRGVFSVMVYLYMRKIYTKE